ncbi:hypothetical protein HDU93_008373 [Gonapodya sp. JEL0774]|nr:hypothetical protein HDU93_008373 [Gonapodya sp. JEL0774]
MYVLQAPFIHQLQHLTPLYLCRIAYGTSIGLSASTATLILSLQNGITSPSRVLLGLFMDRVGAVNVFLACNVIGGVLCLTLWPYAKDLGSLLAFAILFGATGAQFFSQMPIVVAGIFGPRDSASKIGLVMWSLVVGAILGNYAGGQILDNHTTPNPSSPTGYDQDFFPVMVYTGVIFLVSCVFFAAMRYRLVGWRWSGMA